MPRTTEAPDGEDISTELRTSVRPGSACAFVLVVVQGPDAGLRFSIDDSHPTRVLLGQSPACELRVTDTRVSRRHAAIELDSGALRVTDLGSTNGTFANNIGILDAHLYGGEVLSVGDTVLRVERIDADSPALVGAAGFGGLIGASPEMRRLYPLCERLARTDVPVILEGETGTGKEVLAEALHEEGPRGRGPFVVFDCTAVPPTLAESALFGHERGAFTGAVDTRQGVFEEAHGGTLLIDEIGDLQLDLQAKLLRVIQRLEVRRVGGKRPIKVDVRILAATRRDLDREVQAQRFRDDLFYRLAVARVELPPLRRRRGDVALLAEHFWRQFAPPDQPFPAELVPRLEDYGWPGNVRELENAIAARAALGELAEVKALRSASTAPPSGGDLVAEVLALDLPLPRARQKVVDAFDRLYLTRVLAKHGGSVVRAAKASGIARRYFQILRARGRG